jgi:DNA-binding winged helix-turn-helix (wHTH) protein
VLDDIEIDLKSMCGWLSGQCLDLTRNEFRLLRLLLLCPDRVLSHEEIRGQLYRNADECSQNAVEVLVARLRRKVGKKRIVTVRGIGYRFKTGIVSTAPAVDELEPCHSSDRNGDGPVDDLQAPQERQRSESSQYLWAYTI